LQYYEGNFSQVIASFGGQLVSILECNGCRQRSYTYEPFLDLSLPIPDKVHLREGQPPQTTGAGHKVSLMDCLDTFCASETLDGENMYHCATCDCRRIASKQLRVVRCPKILVLHIKRFCYTNTTREKLVTELTLPESGLDLSSFLHCPLPKSSAASPPIYDLKAVTLHTGGIGGGHYHALCVDVDDGHWYHYNDSTVSKSGNAYTLNPKP
jgi:ubiquitin C-terminal hydrolase